MRCWQPVPRKSVGSTPFQTAFRDHRVTQNRRTLPAVTGSTLGAVRSSTLAAGSYAQTGSNSFLRPKPINRFSLGSMKTSDDRVHLAIGVRPTSAEFEANLVLRVQMPAC